MTYAPATIRAVRALLKGQDSDLDDNELGIVGGPSHIAEGTSFHLGKDQLKMSKNPYSARHPRDKAGLSNAASALDVDDDLDELREMSVWIVEQCRAGAPDTRDFAEIIFSPNGVDVYRWNADTNTIERSNQLSHRTHTHFAWRRDSEYRDKTSVFKRYFEEGKDMPTAADVWNVKISSPALNFSGAASEWLKYAVEAARSASTAVALLEKIAEKVGTDPAELAAIREAARAGAEAGVIGAADELAAAIIAALPDDVASRDDVKDALREVLLTGAAPAVRDGS